MALPGAAIFYKIKNQIWYFAFLFWHAVRLNIHVSRLLSDLFTPSYFQAFPSFRRIRTIHCNVTFT